MSSSLDLPQLLQMLAAQQGGSKGALDVSSALVNLLVGQGQSPSTQNQPQQNNARTTVASGMQEHAPRSSQQEAQAQAAESPLQHQLQKIIDQLQQQQDHLQNQLKHKQAQKQQLEQQQQVLLQQTQAGNLQQQQSEGDLDIRKLLFQALQGNNGLGTSAGTVGLNSMQQMTPQQSTSPDLNSLLALVGQGNNLGLAGLLQAANGSGPAPQPVASAPAMAAPGPALNLQNPALSAIVDLLLKQNHEASRQSSGAGGSLRAANIVRQTAPQPTVQGHAPAPSVGTGPASAPAAFTIFDLLLNTKKSASGLSGSVSLVAAMPSALPGSAFQQQTGTSNLAAVRPASPPRSPNSALRSSIGNSLNDVFVMRLSAQLKDAHQSGNQVGGNLNAASPISSPSFLQPQPLRSSPEITPNTSVSVSSDSNSGGVTTVSSSNDSVPSVAPSKGSHHGIEALGVDPSYPLTEIEYPGQNDCMFGRGGGTSNHIGNINFRLLVEKFKKRYAEANKLDKPHVAELVVRQWRARNPPGRFLARTNPEEGTMSKWHDVGDKRARRKCAQALREKHGRCWDESCNVEPPPIAAPAAKRPRIN